MFTVYYANRLDSQKDLLVNILKNDPNPNPFEQEIILVKSLGMAQWLQMNISNDLGIAANIQFTYPTTFLWQQYRLLFSELPKENIFDRQSILWRLMRLIPRYLNDDSLVTLNKYLKEKTQIELYQLCSMVADLFDQYLVYRPEWLIEWEHGHSNIKKELLSEISYLNNKDEKEIFSIIEWQAFLWAKLVEEIKSETSEIIINTSHRAYLQKNYINKLANLNSEEKSRLPKRIFIFGISSLPRSYFSLLYELSKHLHIHLFFTNPCRYYWGDIQDRRFIEKLILKNKHSSQDLEILYQNQGNKLISTWGKQGKEFLNLLVESDIKSVEFYTNYYENDHLLNQIKNAILNFEDTSEFIQHSDDISIQIHSCHSKMREIEVLHNQLLYLFEHDPSLSPKDIIVMSPDIDSYAPYIEAVFSRYITKEGNNDDRFIPFSLSDQKSTSINPIINSFLKLLSLKENRFIAEDILDLLNVESIRRRYNFNDEQYEILRKWIRKVGIRSGLNIENAEWSNYNSWQNGINRLLLGISLKEENNIWQDTLPFSESYGLASDIIGNFVKFIDNLTTWFEFIQEKKCIAHWQEGLKNLINHFYQEDDKNINNILSMHTAINNIVSHIHKANFIESIDIEIIQQLIEIELNEQRNHLHFLSGKVNFCTLLPMRAIPFKVVCLLGMNEGDFPRQQQTNPFDLMQYAPMIGDRAKRDDDRYLFLEALLSAQSIFYISYIGQSLTDNNEKLPSLLVSQLIDYININKLDHQFKPIKHPITVFSQKNFKDNYISYDNEWLEITKKHDNLTHFLDEINYHHGLLEIDILDLVRYLQDPLKYFFNYQLGIRFEHYDDAIEETEIFNLSNLERYNALDEILVLNPKEIDLFFEHEKIKGKLPINEFSKISILNLKNSISKLQNILHNYLSKDKITIASNFIVDVYGKEFKLIGDIDTIPDKLFIKWRVGKLRDKDIIESWIYYLIIVVLDIEITTFRFYYLDNEEAKYITFSTISKDQASDLLKQYIQDYLDSFKNIKWAVTKNIKHYIQHYASETLPSDYCRTALTLIQNPYLERVLAQSPNLDLANIHHRTFHWFEPMIEHLIEEKE